MKNNFQEDVLWNKNDGSAKIMLSDWLKLDCINLFLIIPVLGPIIALVFYIVLACRKDTATSVRTRIQANLIWLLISLILSLFAFVVVLLIFYKTASGM